ncbi:hypothetical protein BH18THE2_BH18THE2_40540 [soil metagenome]
MKTEKKSESIIAYLKCTCGYAWGSHSPKKYPHCPNCKNSVTRKHQSNIQEVTAVREGRQSFEGYNGHLITTVIRPRLKPKETHHESTRQ